MLLFYSPACRHCGMLMDSIKRFDSQGLIKCVDVGGLRKTHPNIFSQIQMVPALMLPNKQYLFGKAVFDYLLIPGRGILVSGAGGAGGAGGAAGSSQQPPSTRPDSGASNHVLHQEEGIIPFNSSKGSFGDAFASIDENHSTPKDPNTNPHSQYNWTSIEDMVRLGNPDAPTSSLQSTPMSSSAMNVAIEAKMAGMNIETRAPKESLDLDSLRLQRERDIQSLYASQPMPMV